MANNFTPQEVSSVQKFLGKHSVAPIAFASVDGRIRFSFMEQFVTPAIKRFLDARIGDPRRREVATIDELYSGEIYRFIWAPASPDSIFEEEGHFKSFSRRDYEPQEDLCDILPITATKANATLQLKSMLGCDKMVVFGDGLNDLSMFSVADEKYAVENAIPELKEIATAVIGSNAEDGVARWIEENAL